MLWHKEYALYIMCSIEIHPLLDQLGRRISAVMLTVYTFLSIKKVSTGF